MIESFHFGLRGSGKRRGNNVVISVSDDPDAFTEPAQRKLHLRDRVLYAAATSTAEIFELESVHHSRRR